jgi:hypothetical protein
LRTLTERAPASISRCRARRDGEPLLLPLRNAAIVLRPGFPAEGFGFGPAKALPLDAHIPRLNGQTVYKIRHILFVQRKCFIVGFHGLIQYM